MDIDIMMAFAILVAAVSGFVVLATVLMGISRSSVWRRTEIPAAPMPENESDRQSSDLDAQECYRQCMEHPARGTEKSMPSCAEACGMSSA